MTAHLFTIVPNTGSPSFTETFDELTAISTARWSGKEQAHACRAYPRLQFGGSFVLGADEEQALRGALLSGSPLLLPAWMHPVRDVAGGLGVARLDALYNADNYGSIELLCMGEYGEVRAFAGVDPAGALTDALPVGTWSAWPLIDATLADDSFAVESKSGSIKQVSLSFEIADLDEGDSNPTPTTPEGLLQLPTTADSNPLQSGPASFEYSLQTDTFDAGHIRLKEVLYSRGVASVQLVALTRAEVVALRAFIRACRGRAVPFLWTNPTTGETALYRLAADSNTLNYLTTTTATASLKFVEVKG